MITSLGPDRELSRLISSISLISSFDWCVRKFMCDGAWDRDDAVHRISYQMSSVGPMSNLQLRPYKPISP
jgi:hypothetical protein